MPRPPAGSVIGASLPWRRVRVPSGPNPRPTELMPIVAMRPLTDHWVSVVRAGDVISLLPWAVAVSAWVLAQLGETAEALNRLREAEQLLECHPEWGGVGNRCWCYLGLGHACLVLGRLDQARRLGQTLIESRNHAGFAAHALRLLGDIATHATKFDAGEAHYREALGLAEPRGMRPLVAHCHLGLGKLARRADQREQAQEHLVTRFQD